MAVQRHEFGRRNGLDIHAFLGAALRLPITLRSHQDLALPAFDVALDRGLSVYDASYVVLAEALDAILVTADRTLASAAPEAELIA